jgi:hypothetical protein
MSLALGVRRGEQGARVTGQTELRELGLLLQQSLRDFFAS